MHRRALRRTLCGPQLAPNQSIGSAQSPSRFTPQKVLLRHFLGRRHRRQQQQQWLGLRIHNLRHLRLRRRHRRRESVVDRGRVRVRSLFRALSSFPFLSVAVRLGGREVCRVHARSSRVTSEIIGVRMCENVRPSNEGHGAVALNLTFVVPLSVT